MRVLGFSSVVLPPNTRIFPPHSVVHLLSDLGLDFSSLETGAKVHVMREINPMVSAGI